MAQRLILVFFTLVVSVEGISQQLKVIANQEFSSRSGQWFKKSSNGKYYKVDTDLITIKFRTNEVQDILSKHGLSILRKSSEGYYDLRVPKHSSVLDLAEKVLKDHASIVESVDVNTYGEYNFSPNDLEFSGQWYLDKIKMTSAWDNVRGNNCIQIAVIDTGLDIAHEDIGRGVDTYDNLWQNAGEDAWTDPNNPATGNGIDNDGNGLIDDWRGWDFNASNNDVRSPGIHHGTRVSGIISAKLNNGRGISGIGGGANNTGLQVMFLGTGDLPNSAAIDDAILYAVAKGADVIQMSLSVAQTAAIDNAIQTAINNGIPVVCASGNNSAAVSYPARNANVIAVGATNQNDQKRPASNFGSELFIAAPGENIRSTQIGNTYGNDNGTSFAAPQVSAVIGLMKNIDPTLTIQEIKNILMSTADKVGGVNYSWDPNRPGHSKELGFGRLNAYAALNAVSPVSGPATICVSGSTYSVSNLPPGATTPVWSASSNISINPSSGFATSVGNGSGWVRAGFTVPCAGGVNITRNFANVGLISSISGPTYIALNTSKIFNATASCGPSPYVHDWFLKNETENLGEHVMVGSGSSLTLKSVNDPTLPFVATRTFSLYVRTGDAINSIYFTNVLYITTKGRGNLVPFGPGIMAQNEEAGNDFALYPNPSVDYFEIGKVNQNGDNPLMIKVYNSQGNLVLNQTFNHDQHIVDVKKMQPGLYSVHILFGDGLVQRKQLLIKK